VQYDTCKHCVFYHRYHIVWSTKYRYKVLTGALRQHVRDICRQVCRENEVDILRGVVSGDHVHMFVSVPPKPAISDLVRKMKGRSSCRVQREFPAIRRRYRGCRFWGRGYFSTTNGAITQDIALQCLEQHIADPSGRQTVVVQFRHLMGWIRIEYFRPVVRVLKMFSYGVSPLSVLRHCANSYAARKQLRCARN